MTMLKTLSHLNHINKGNFKLKKHKCTISTAICRNCGSSRNQVLLISPNQPKRQRHIKPAARVNRILKSWRKPTPSVTEYLPKKRSSPLLWSRTFLNKIDKILTTLHKVQVTRKQRRKVSHTPQRTRAPRPNKEPQSRSLSSPSLLSSASKKLPASNKFQARRSPIHWKTMICASTRMTRAARPRVTWRISLLAAP